MQLPVFFGMDAVTAEYQVRHRYQRQSALKKGNTFILER